MSKKSRTRIREINIVETPAGWLWRERGTKRRAAADMQRFIKRDTKKTVQPHECLITVINWHPKTRVGFMVVEALTDSAASVACGKDHR